MNQKLFLLLFVIVTSSSVCNAQKVQSYSGSKSYTTTVGYIPGTEKYSYIIDERGRKVFHGAYSFVGKNQLNDDNTKYVANYSLTANYKQGNLNGTYSINETIEGKVWKYIKGWIPFSASAKLTATFADSKPAGTFNATYKDAMNYYGTVTMKDGKYVGSYDYYGEGYKSLWKIKGQLSDKGKLVGSWKVHNITERKEWDMVFDNDVLISKDDKSSITPPTVQSVAKQFATGKLTEEQIKDQGYILKKKTLPLDNFISYLLLLDDDDFAFNQISGWDFSDYKAKEYWEIEKPDILSEEGFNKIIEFIRVNGTIREYKEPIDRYYSYSCWLNPYYNPDGYFYLNCNVDFHAKYGYYTQLDDGSVVLTPNQYSKLITVQDSVAVASPWQYSSYAFKVFCEDSNLARQILLDYDDQQRLIEKNALQKAYESIAEKLSDTLLVVYFGSLNGFGWRRSRTIQAGDSCYYVADSTYIICRNNTDIDALSVSHIKQLNTYEQFIQECENIGKNIIADSKKLNTDLGNQIYDRAYSKSKKFLTKLQESFTETFNASNMSKKEVVIEKVKAIRKQHFINTNRNAELETSLSKKFLNNYKNLYKSRQELPIFNTIEEAEQYEKKLVNTQEMQDEFVSINELYSTIEKKHVELENLCGKPYADVFKPYAAKYKTTMAVPNIETTNDISTYVSQLESIKADQQLRTDYINIRKRAEQLNGEIVEICASTKNCKRLYTALYKELPMLWDESADNISIAQNNIQLLTSIKDILEKQDLTEFDKQLKKVKKAEEFKTALGL